MIEYADHVLAKEGSHAVALVPRPSGGFAYALLHLRPSGEYVLRCQDVAKQAVLDALWRLECKFAAALNWPDDPSFGLRLHKLISGRAYPLNVARLAAMDAAALPHFLEWC